jgi:hypothetical protein
MKELIEIQSKLNAPKSQRNKFGNFNYRSCEDILEAVKPLLKEYGCLLTLDDSIAMAGDRHYIKATATIKKDDNKESASAFAREPIDQKGMSESQVTGSTSSYARKYALNGLFLIDDSKDVDVETSKEEKDAQEQSERIIKSIESARNTKELTAVRNKLETKGLMESKYIEHLKARHSEL